MEKPVYKRVLLKISGEALSGEQGRGLDFDVMDCAVRGGTAAAVMSAANECAVDLFLQEKLGFNSIFDIVSDAVGKIALPGTPSLEILQDADSEARHFVTDNYRKY